ncbi:MAG TPA: hypothetical protein VFK39_10230, partial [Gemmatimonadaceae bacterium]|nr:hypothetical protein [Gemmatimonadaceae bacterium]
MAKRTIFPAREATGEPAEGPAELPPGDIADDAAGEQPVSRRDFFFRAGQLGALSVLGPGLHGGLGIFDADAPPAAEHKLAEHALPSVAAPEIASLYSGLRWRHLGPFRGGRTDAVSGVPGRPNEFYYGAVNGGVWKTHDAGRTWQPVFDSQP